MKIETGTVKNGYDPEFEEQIIKDIKWLSFDEVTALDGKKINPAKETKAEERTPEQKAMVEAEIAGSRKLLRYDAILPMGMAAIYLILLFYFKSIGGYKPVQIDEQKA